MKARAPAGRRPGRPDAAAVRGIRTSGGGIQSEYEGRRAG